MQYSKNFVDLLVTDLDCILGSLSTTVIDDGGIPDNFPGMVRDALVILQQLMVTVVFILPVTQLII